MKTWAKAFLIIGIALIFLFLVVKCVQSLPPAAYSPPNYAPSQPGGESPIIIIVPDSDDNDDGSDDSWYDDKSDPGYYDDGSDDWTDPGDDWGGSDDWSDDDGW